ncbi:MAG: magnetosome biogenesis transporter MamZ [Alphaproteobacteria bacterium]
MSSDPWNQTATLPKGLKASQWNVVYLLAAAGALVSSLSVAIQPLLLGQVFGIAFEKEGSINADIQVVVEILSVLCVGWLGLMSDRVGRVRVIFIGLMIVCAGAVLAVFSLGAGMTLGLGTGALLLFYLTRVLITSGADTVGLQLSTLVGDVSDRANRPRLMTNVVFMMVFGSTVLSALVMQVTERSFGVYVVMCLPLLIGGAGFLAARRSLTDVAPAHDQDVPPLLRVWELVSHDPRMQLAFAAAFYTRADVILFSLFFSLWCSSVADMVGVTRLYASAHAAGMIGLLGVVILVAIPVWRAFIERHSRISAIGASLSLAALGYIALGLFVNPFNGWVAVPLLLIGIGHAGCSVTLKVLTVDISPKPILGAMLGSAYMTGGAGIILLVQSSGYYFDAVGPRAPFLLMGTGKMLVTLFAAWLLLHGIDETADHHMKNGRRVDWKPLMFLTSALPFLWLIGRSLTGGYLTGGSLADTPVGFINRYLGDWAFTFLIISLALRPLQEMTGLKTLARYRRMFGLYAFFYVMLHIGAYVALEWAFNFQDMLSDIHKRPFILLGLAAITLLVPLAATSTNRQMKRLGARRWKKLHQMTYVINVLVALHFLFAAARENGEPYVYAAVVAGLLGYRYRQYALKKRKTAG